MLNYQRVKNSARDLNLPNLATTKNPTDPTNKKWTNENLDLVINIGVRNVGVHGHISLRPEHEQWPPRSDVCVYIYIHVYIYIYICIYIYTYI